MHIIIIQLGSPPNLRYFSKPIAGLKPYSMHEPGDRSTF